jgi:3-oxoacyl-[acyl-carrier protein] reductase
MLKGKNIIITGATSGIGRGIAQLFAKQGASLALLGTNEQRAQEVLQECMDAKTTEQQVFHTYLLDISKTKQVKETIAKILQEFDFIDVLINNAGITKDTLLMKMQEEDFDRVMEVNIKSVYNTCHTLIRPFIKQKKGTIINITSVVGITGNAGQCNYAASKAAVIGFTKSLAKEVAGRNIRVNCIAPGYVQTEMTSILSEDIQKKILQSIPMKKMGNIEDIAQAASFLASDQSSYITGQTLIVDGGMIM